MAKFIILKNEFHGTEVKMKVPAASGYFTKDQIRRAKRTLCGIKDCKCGGIMGENGPQKGVDLRIVQQSFIHYDTRGLEDD